MIGSFLLNFEEFCKSANIEELIFFGSPTPNSNLRGIVIAT
jgi:hypothetical protein